MSETGKNNYFIRADKLCMHFPVNSDFRGHADSFVHAADDVSFEIPKGKALGVVGESGCGKSTVAKMLMNIYKPTSGSIFYDGEDITELQGTARREYVRKMQLVWQDPYSSLDPRKTAYDIIAEGMRNFKLAESGAEEQEKVLKLMESCGLFPDQAARYPHQFSGGQRQRICIARALSTDPEFIVCDEAVSALDVSIQAQILNLLKDLQDEFSLTYLFISHDLNVVNFISDEIIVMYLGQIVERGTMEKVYANRAHPYTKALFSATPVFSLDRDEKRERIILKGDVMSPVDPPSGCRFQSRCPYKTAKCGSEEPEWAQIEDDHFVKCHLFQNQAKTTSEAQSF